MYRPLCFRGLSQVNANTSESQDEREEDQTFIRLPACRILQRLRKSATVSADNTLHDALHLAVAHADGFKLRVGGLQADVVVFLEEGLQGC